MSTFCGRVVAGSRLRCADISDLDTTAGFFVEGVALGVVSGIADIVLLVPGATISLPDLVSCVAGCLDFLPLVLTMARGLVCPPWERTGMLDGLEVTVVL